MRPLPAITGHAGSKECASIALEDTSRGVMSEVSATSCESSI